MIINLHNGVPVISSSGCSTRDILGKQIRYVENLSDKIKDSLNWYTGGGFDKLNENLRKGKPLTTSQKKHFDNISKAFRDCPEICTRFVVYKGKNSKNVYPVDKAFFSTSLSIKKAEEFSSLTGFILKIIVLPGVKALPLKGLSRYEEDEVLLDKNLYSKVIGVEGRIINIKISNIPFQTTPKQKINWEKFKSDFLKETEEEMEIIGDDWTDIGRESILVSAKHYNYPSLPEKVIQEILTEIELKKLI